MLAISACACALRTSRLTRSSMPCSLRPSKSPFMHMSAPSSGAKYTRPILCCIAGPLGGVPPQPASEAVNRSVRAALRDTDMTLPGELLAEFERAERFRHVIGVAIDDAGRLPAEE